MVFTLTVSDTEATDIIAPLISYLCFINKSKREECGLGRQRPIASIFCFGFSITLEHISAGCSLRS